MQVAPHSSPKLGRGSHRSRILPKARRTKQIHRWYIPAKVQIEIDRILAEGRGREEGRTLALATRAARFDFFEQKRRRNDGAGQAALC
jgi:hypothetical protein